MRGPFDIPRSTYQSTKGARKAYFIAFAHEFTEDDAYIREIAQEAQSCNDLIILMREVMP